LRLKTDGSKILPPGFRRRYQPRVKQRFLCKSPSLQRDSRRRAWNLWYWRYVHPPRAILDAPVHSVHGSRTASGTVGPIIATTLVTHGITWSRFYLVVLGIRILALIFAGYSFWHYEEEAPARLLSALERTASRQNATEENAPTKTQLMKQALNNRVTFISALFIFAYQGAETSVSGWVISFLISYRNGDPAHVGYVTAGFWVRHSAHSSPLSYLHHHHHPLPFSNHYR
jgi:hypothetical protein